MIDNILLFNYNYSIFKKGNLSYLYIYNNNYTCVLKMKNNIKIFNKLNLIIKTDGVGSIINNFIKQFYISNIVKVKFTGKGYKIKKNTNNNIQLLFNKAHITNVWYKNIILKKLKKYKILVRHINGEGLIKKIINVRPVNIFTKKGLRLARQNVYKKKGKK